MTDLELHKFINDNNIEWKRENKQETPDVLIFVNIWQLEMFCKLIKCYREDDGGLVVHLFCGKGYGYVAIWMNELCDHYGIDIDKVFVGQNSWEGE